MIETLFESTRARPAPDLHVIPSPPAPDSVPTLVLWNPVRHIPGPAQPIAEYEAEVTLHTQRLVEQIKAYQEPPTLLTYDGHVYLNKDALVTYKLPHFPPYARYLAAGFVHYVRVHNAFAI